MDASRVVNTMILPPAMRRRTGDLHRIHGMFQVTLRRDWDMLGTEEWYVARVIAECPVPDDVS